MTESISSFDDNFKDDKELSNEEKRKKRDDLIDKQIKQGILVCLRQS
jgi:hypothetical protein